MSPARLRLAVLGAITLLLVVALWSCSGGGGDDSDDTAGHTTTSTTADPASDGPDRELGPAFVPITGPEAEDGTPEPPPVHAVFSVVVRGDTSWDPYGGPELTGLDTAAAQADATRLRRLGQVLRELGIPASIELAYGPASALCELDPDVFADLEAAGHRIGIHASSRGEVFRAHRALGDCGIVPTTVSGLPAIADPTGPAPPTPQSVVDAFAVLSVLDLHQVVGEVSPMCTALGLAEPTHAYGTGAFTAPWRSAWLDDRPCSDSRAGRIVVIDQTGLRPPEGDTVVTATSLSAIGHRTDQVLGWALDHRYVEAPELPAPGFITWGVTVRLADLVAPPATAGGDDDGDDDQDGDEREDGTDEGTDGGEGATTTTSPPGDRRLAPLDEELLTALVELATERWLPAMERGRLRWMLPDDVALIFRPLEPALTTG